MFYLHWLPLIFELNLALRDKEVLFMVLVPLQLQDVVIIEGPPYSLFHIVVLVVHMTLRQVKSDEFLLRKARINKSVRDELAFHTNSQIVVLDLVIAANHVHALCLIGAKEAKCWPATLHGPGLGVRIGQLQTPRLQ